MSEAWREPQVAPVNYELDAETLLRTLVGHDVEFVVVGGLAVAAHGFVRATKDLDIVPLPESANRNRLFEALESLGAQPIEIGDFRPEEPPVQFAPEALDEGGNWALLTSAGRIDVLQWLAGVEGFEQLRRGALSAEVSGVGVVHFAGYDDLVAMKRAAGRPQDEADLAALDELRHGSR